MKEVPDGYNEEKAYRVAYLVAAFIRNTLTDDEREELDQWVTESDENMKLFAELTDERNIKNNLARIEQIDKESAWKELLSATREVNYEKPRSHARKWLYIAAASVALLTAGFFIYNPFLRNMPAMAENKKADLLPGGDKAVLTLSNGSHIILDSTFNDSLIRDGLSEIISKEGQIVYDRASQQPSGVVVYNTIATPNGGQFKVVLPDGSRVWLNAASSIRYPLFFPGKERKVEITGEAYFEIVKEAGKKFIVTCGDLETEVLGTAFNINGYDDEASTKVTLLEGSVKVSGGQSSLIIKPGQQARINERSQLALVTEPDIEESTSWKDGMFYFKDARIEEIMLQVARWYDVKVEYQARPVKHLNAIISRNIPVSRLFELLQKTGEVNFEIQDKTIIVKP